MSEGRSPGPIGPPTRFRNETAVKANLMGADSTGVRSDTGEPRQPREIPRGLVPARAVRYQRNVGRGPGSPCDHLTPMGHADRSGGAPERTEGGTLQFTRKRSSWVPAWGQLLCRIALVRSAVAGKEIAIVRSTSTTTRHRHPNSAAVAEDCSLPYAAPIKKEPPRAGSARETGRDERAIRSSTTRRLGRRGASSHCPWRKVTDTTGVPYGGSRPIPNTAVRRSEDDTRL